MDQLTPKGRPRVRGRRVIPVAAVLLALMVVLPVASASPPEASPSPGESLPPQGLDPSSSPSPSADPSPSPSVEPSPLRSVSCVLSQTKVIYGSVVTVSGVVSPASERQEVAISLAGTDIGTATTGADGRFSVDIRPKRGGAVVVRLVADGTISPARQLVVKPWATTSYGTPIPFLSLRYVIRVKPSNYAGTIATSVWHNGKRIATHKKRVRDGRAVFELPMRGVGLFTVKSSYPAFAGLDLRNTSTGLRTRGATLRVGSRGPRVRGFLTGLRRLQIRVPSIGDTLTRGGADAVMAFQKAYGLPRTYVVSGDDWRKLDVAKTIRPRYSSPYDHLEVDKRRQIMMLVRGGAVRALIAVSTGATGNTPEGRFRIQQKHPFTLSFSGGAVLYRTMGFYGNFAIHGYPSVPPYPASHGCVREPMWVADWVYDRSFVGERVYVYR